MKNKNIYIEFIGFSCIGKTYLRDKIYEVIEADKKFTIYKRTNKLTAFFKSIKNTKYSDIKVMIDLYIFIRRNRKYSILKALNRTFAILLRPLQYREKIENSIVIVDDGPIGKLSTNGIYDESWLKLLDTFRPSNDEYNTIYIFLTLDEVEHKRRLELRGEKTIFLESNSTIMINNQKASKNKRIEAYRFWSENLKKNFSKCLFYKMEEYSAEDLSKRIYKEIIEIR